MFTGLIEQVGTLTARRCSGTVLTLEIAAFVWPDLKTGDSVACNGACLTVVEIKKTSLCFEVMEETVRRTLFGGMPLGSKINMERALSAAGRLDGHFVQGHIDGTGVIREIRQQGESRLLTVSFPPEQSPLVTEKGSIALDGISLTVMDVGYDSFRVGIIPHTWEKTSLNGKKAGDRLHLEYDIIGKYVYRSLQGMTDKNKKGPRSLEEALQEW
ncbi:MAG TPA: riboflavin synthase [Candidatus Mcinerneyibacteriales bacterium]|nr:riboflavin synthase [Candidatus Mcinerneyibacteriales bacterium]